MIGTIVSQGVEMPRLGLGTFQMRGDTCRVAVEGALGLGYRHIDTAEAYGNEAEVGAALATARLRRDEIFVTTKVWFDHLAPADLRRALEASLERLRLDHVDLYLIHWPARDMDLAGTLATLLRLRDAGLTRAIGVANFTVPLLRAACEEIGAPLACNQVEYHPLLGQDRLLAYMRSRAIPLVAYSPLARGRILDSPELRAIGAKHRATAAQVAIRWLLDQPGVCVIPKAQRRESQRANLDAVDLRLDDDDRRFIASLRKDLRIANPGFAPEWD